MELKMQIDGREMDSIKVHVPACGDELYLTWLKQGLCIKHGPILCRTQAEPVFFLETRFTEKKDHTHHPCT